jgi:AcrR family transcriptional regulator
VTETEKKTVPCKRPYSLGKRLELSGGKRVKILAAARAQLESGGLLSLTLDSLARESGVTRQTIHNLFGTKTGVIEALFDQIALAAGMEQMRAVMRQTDPDLMLTGFVKVFSDFWIKDRLLIRRIHGIAATDPDFGRAVEERNQRRQAAATRLFERMGRRDGEGDSLRKSQSIACLYALTSFEFFDSLAEGCDSADEAARLIPGIVKSTLSALSASPNYNR